MAWENILDPNQDKGRTLFYSDNGNTSDVTIYPNEQGVYKVPHYEDVPFFREHDYDEKMADTLFADPKMRGKGLTWGDAYAVWNKQTRDNLERQGYNTGRLSPEEQRRAMGLKSIDRSNENNSESTSPAEFLAFLASWFYRTLGSSEIIEGALKAYDNSEYNEFKWNKEHGIRTDYLDQETRRRYAHKYRTEDRPYSYKLDTSDNRYQHWGNPSAPTAISKLGLFGLISDKKSYDTWHLIDNNGNQVKQCAKFGNHFNSMVGKPTAGDAWTTKGIYGDSVIYKAPVQPVKNIGFLNDPILQFNKITEIDRDKLETGDIVDLYNPSSHYVKRAEREGRGNSHTGRIYKPNGMEGPTYVIHNVNGNIKVDPIGKFFRPLHGAWNITRIARPGTSDHPYNEE